MHNQLDTRLFMLNYAKFTVVQIFLQSYPTAHHTFTQKGDIFLITGF